MRISQITRRDIIDAITVEQITWNGRLEEAEFLARLFDLGSLPSSDRRFPDAAGFA
jgi:AbiJ N-terminal domain 3